jgi:hypothetical protein
LEKEAESESAAAFSGRQCESHDRGCAFDRRSGEADPDRLPGTENCQKPNKNHLRKGIYVPNSEQQELPGVNVRIPELHQKGLEYAAIRDEQRQELTKKEVDL